MTNLEVRGTYSVSTQDYAWVKESGFAYDARTFRFGTDTDASDGVWQVSSVPFPSTASFDPACLLLTGKTTGIGTPAMPFQFSIDFASLQPKIELIQFSPFEDSLGQTHAFSAPYLPGNLNSSEPQRVNVPKWNSGALGMGNPNIISFDPCAQNVSAEGVATYYVRVLPVKYGQPAGTPSNPVILHYYPNSDIKIEFVTIPYPHDIGYEVKILNFTGVNFPEQKYQYCVVVVKNDNPLVGYKPGDVLCPEPFTGGNGDFLEELSKAVESTFNFIADAYNKLSDWVTDLVDKLNPLCIQAKLASSAVNAGQQEVKDACHFIAVAAVTAAKTYVGLPPSLPNFDELTELGKDNLVELAAQELEANGIPCPEECKDVIRQGVDYSIEQVQNGMSNSSCFGEEEAHQNGIEPLCPPTGVITKPDPRGQPAPAILEVQVTRMPGETGPDIPEPTSCNVTVDAYATNDSHVGEKWTTEVGFDWNGTYIEGNLFSGAGAFPALQPGESVSFPIVLEPVSHWLAGHQEFAKQTWKPEHFDDWNILYQGALAAISADGVCKFEFPEGVRFSTEIITGDTIQVGPLGKAWKQFCSPYNCP